MRVHSVLFFFVSAFIGCRRPEYPSIAAPPSTFENPKPAPPQEPPPPQTVKSKPTWVTRSFKDWLQVSCTRDATRCEPMGRVTVLVEFTHKGCKEFKQQIDNQAGLIQGYAPEHQFFLVVAASDALTRKIFDDGRDYIYPCRVFLYDDTLKADKKIPNEDQQLVELCVDATSVSDHECHSELLEKKLYAP
ncbi:hypothetical protein A2318_02705 [Candidatus Uhrbacteria bacterium RIFOXYB2_FULL_45_11]|uniref:Uncharacterized protein n=1 Tax=Candidatus Uhrbacteria bacterium RIFOXYB2_FULL_45_11 TaxID=1802421 RepID=A0A1F7W3H1_9BACT|nr:MAG: hypothetical protein A2318_02705 [Candidatus Uhrbacteria bacterium RIFOXYB2_FULL_45_11]